jgi:hypothetical protein
LVSLIYAAHRGLVYLWDNRWFNLGAATILFFGFCWFVIQVERKEFEKIPFFRKFLKAKAA